MSKKQKKAYKYRFYPTPEQAVMLARTFGCCRVVYNWGLRERTDAYYQRGERLHYDDLAARLTPGIPRIKSGVSPGYSAA